MTKTEDKNKKNCIEGIIKLLIMCFFNTKTKIKIEALEKTMMHNLALVQNIYLLNITGVNSVHKSRTNSDYFLFSDLTIYLSQRKKTRTDQ